MQKIRHGLIALAILGGPASLILVHQNLTEAPAQFARESVDVAALVQQAYLACSEQPVQKRLAPCNDYIRSYDECVARKDECNPRSVYKVLQEMNLTPTLGNLPHATRRRPTDA